LNATSKNPAHASPSMRNSPPFSSPATASHSTPMFSAAWSPSSSKRPRSTAPAVVI
jgi:hypothetical protein